MKKKENPVNYFRMIGCFYLIYLAYNLFSHVEESERPVFGLICAVAFLAGAIVVLGLEWRRYRKGKRIQPETERLEVFEATENNEDSGGNYS